MRGPARVSVTSRMATREGLGGRGDEGVGMAAGRSLGDSLGEMSSCLSERAWYESCVSIRGFNLRKLNVVLRGVEQDGKALGMR
jgi:hypothetical protein